MKRQQKINNMKKITIYIILLTLVSCGVDQSDFTGKWVEKLEFNNSLTITKNGENYLFIENGKKYPAKIKDGFLIISAYKDIVAVIDENDILIIEGREFIRFEKSSISKFVGEFVSENNKDLKYKIEYENGKFIIIKSDMVDKYTYSGNLKDGVLVFNGRKSDFYKYELPTIKISEVHKETLFYTDGDATDLKLIKVK